MHGATLGKHSLFFCLSFNGDQEGYCSAPGPDLGDESNLFKSGPGASKSKLMTLIVGHDGLRTNVASLPYLMWGVFTAYVIFLVFFRVHAAANLPRAPQMAHPKPCATDRG
eukprot:1158537-Pelagomonas_calceolata.AAC.15